jgi:hypothetical protein
MFSPGRDTQGEMTLAPARSVRSFSLAHACGVALFLVGCAGGGDAATDVGHGGANAGSSGAAGDTGAGGLAGGPGIGGTTGIAGTGVAGMPGPGGIGGASSSAGSGGSPGAVS